MDGGEETRVEEESEEDGLVEGRRHVTDEVRSRREDHPYDTDEGKVSGQNRGPGWTS